MAKLNQIVAVEKQVKAEHNKTTAALYHQVQKPEPFKGIARTYQPVSDDPAEALPPESTRVQLRVKDINDRVQVAEAELLDLLATKDTANTKALAPVTVDGKTLIPPMPVTYLLFLEKQLVELRTHIAALPVLDATEEWHYDEAQDAWATAPRKTVKTKKIPRNWVKAEATKEHPAQVEIYHEDVNVGTWTTVQYSGMIPQKEKTEMLERLEAVSKAVKYAREQANDLEVTHIHIAAPLLEYIFGGAPAPTAKV